MAIGLGASTIMFNPYLMALFAIVIASIYLYNLWGIVVEKHRGMYLFLFAFLWAIAVLGLSLLLTSWLLFGAIIWATCVLYVTSAAMWRAASKNHRWWFLGLFIIPTFGILSIYYIYKVEKMEMGEWFY